MSKRFLGLWLVAFIVTVAIDVLWHRFIFGSWYGANGTAARIVNGRLAPIIPFIIIADLLYSGALVYFGGIVSTINKKYVLNGALLGLLVTGYFSLCAYALVPNWSGKVGVADTLAGIVIGVAVGSLLKFWDRKTVS